MASQGSAALQHELDISTKISNLEKKASKLECDFNEMLNAAHEMELAVKKYVKKAEAEHKSAELLEKITDENLYDVMDHVRIFFNFILAKMKLQSADVTDVNMLWHLIDCDGVSRCFTDVILQTGFSLEDVENMKVLSAVVSRIQVDVESKDAFINSETKSSLESSDIGGQTDQSTDSVNDISQSVDNESKSDETNKKCKIHEKIEKANDFKDTQSEQHMFHNTTTPTDLSSLKEAGIPIREALKNMKFVDIDDGMKKLIEKIVCYVAKIRFE